MLRTRLIAPTQCIFAYSLVINSIFSCDRLQQYSKESIQQLVMDAETLVREEILMKTPIRNRHSISESSPSRKKSGGSNIVDSSTTHPKIKRVQEWLQHQPAAVNCTGPPPLLSAATTDCEASGEYTGSFMFFSFPYSFFILTIYLIVNRI